MIQYSLLLSENQITKLLVLQALCELILNMVLLSRSYKFFTFDPENFRVTETMFLMMNWVLKMALGDMSGSNSENKGVESCTKIGFSYGVYLGNN